MNIALSLPAGAQIMSQKYLTEFFARKSHFRRASQEAQFDPSPFAASCNTVSKYGCEGDQPQNGAHGWRYSLIGIHGGLGMPSIQGSTPWSKRGGSATSLPLLTPVGNPHRQPDAAGGEGGGQGGKDDGHAGMLDATASQRECVMPIEVDSEIRLNHHDIEITTLPGNGRTIGAGQ